MASNDYHFVTQWRVQATLEEVISVLDDALSLPRWWPAVYLDVQEIAPGDVNGIGRELDLYIKGWLPYTLRWRFRVSEVEAMTRLVLHAEGDFMGRGIWTFRPDGEWVDLTYDWKITARKPLLRHLSFLFKPIFAANHRWAMRQGEESLRLEIAWRRAQSEQEKEAIPPPPGPTPTNVLDLLWYGIQRGIATLQPQQKK